MRFDLRCGSEKATLETASTTPVGRARFKAVAAESNAVQAALGAPTNSPPLRAALTPSDRVTLLWDARIPHPAAVLEPIWKELSAVGVQAEAVSILLSTGGDVDLQRATLPATFQPCKIAVHDPSSSGDLAYLASTDDGERLYFHRTIVDADFVLPITVVGPDALVGYRSPWSLLHPNSGDERCIERARMFAMEAAGDWNLLAGKQASAEAAWLAGLLMGVGVGLASDGAIAQSWFGMLADVHAAARKWSHAETRRTGEFDSADLAIVAFASAGRPLGWDEFAVGMANARRLAPDCGVFLAITDVSDPPNEAIRWLGERDDFSGRRSRFRTAAARKAPDGPAAAALAEVLSAAKVYLYSSLEPDQIEPLGLVAVPTLAAAATLVKRAGRVLSIEDADLLWPVV